LGQPRHSALSYEHAGKIEAQLKAEVADLLAKAEAADQADVPDGMSLPEELARREKRLETLAVARATIEARAKERFEREQAEYQAKLEARAAKVAGGGFEQCYNAQAVVAADSLLVVAVDVVQAANDKQQLQPIWRFGTFTCRERNAEMLNKVVALPEALGKAETLLADNGYFSAANVTACDAAKIEPLIAMGREAHHPSLDQRFAKAPPPPKNPTPLEAMAYRLQTPDGRKLYALRKQMPEPVFGIIKSVLGFRQFLLRGLDQVRGEWSLVAEFRPVEAAMEKVVELGSQQRLPVWRQDTSAVATGTTPQKRWHREDLAHNGLSAFRERTPVAEQQLLCSRHQEQDVGGMTVDDVEPVMQAPELMLEVVRHRRNGGGQRTAGAIQFVPHDVVAPGMEGRVEELRIGQGNLPVGPGTAFAAMGPDEQKVGVDVPNEGQSGDVGDHGRLGRGGRRPEMRMKRLVSGWVSHSAGLQPGSRAVARHIVVRFKRRPRRRMGLPPFLPAAPRRVDGGLGDPGWFFANHLHERVLPQVSD
jgi:hypothetical protein